MIANQPDWARNSDYRTGVFFVEGQNIGTPRFLALGQHTHVPTHFSSLRPEA